MTDTKIDCLSEMGIQRWSRRVFDEVIGDEAKADEVIVDAGLGLTETKQREKAVTVDGASVEVPIATATHELGSETEILTDTWAALVGELEEARLCTGCHSSNPILGEGDLTAEWVWIFDAPASKDISAQQLVSGRAGQLFDAILKAVGLEREQIYLTSVFKCPPSEDYTAQAGCGELLRRQLALIEPKKIVVFGEFAAQALLRSNSPLEQLRESVHQPRTLACDVITTHSIEDMLSQPALKAQVWQDLCLLLSSQ